MKKSRKHLIIAGALMALVAIAATVPVGTILRPMFTDTNGVVVIPGNIWVANSNAIKTVVPQGTVRSVGATSQLSGITISGGPVTDQGEISLTGVLGLASGGTGGTNQASARAGIGLNSGNSSNFWRGDGQLAELPGILPDLAASNGAGVTNVIGGEIVVPPLGISPQFTIYRIGGAYSTSLRMDDYARSTRATTLYLSTNGNDSSSGLTWADAKLTLGGALSGVTSSVAVYCGPGIYVADGVTNRVTFTNDISLVCTGGVAQFGQFTLSSYSGHFGGIRFQGGNSGSFVWNNTNALKILTADKCGFDGNQADGLVVNANAGLVYLRDCGAYSNKLDGLGYQALTGTSSLWVLEERCTASWNGWTTNKANNGSTIHSGVSIVRIGCTAYKNEGRNFHDIGSGVSWNINCSGGGSRIEGADTDVAFACASASDSTTMILEGCEALFGSPLSYLYGTNGNLVVLPFQRVNDAQIVTTTDIQTQGYFRSDSGVTSQGTIFTQATVDQTGSGTSSLRSSGGAAITKSLYVGTYTIEQSLVLRGTNQLVAPTGLSVMGAQLWTDGTNVSTVIQGSSGSRATNNVVLADRASGLISAANLPFPQTYWFTNQGVTTNWTIPTGARSLLIKVVARGGPGGSGRRYASGTIAAGGGGGGGGGYAELLVGSVTTLWTNLLVISIPAVGAGGASVTTDDSNGTNGAAAAYTTVSVGSTATTNQLIRALSGDPGVGGDGDGSSGGNGGTVVFAGSNGGASSPTGASGTIGAGILSNFAAAGGGGGGGITTGSAPSSGGAGGTGPTGMFPSSAASAGAIASNGTNYNANWRSSIASGVLSGWPGAGGGGSSTNSAGGNGADGYGWGSGGGGGGASLNGFASGAGGNGGPSAVSITVYCAFPAIVAPEWIGAAVQWTMDAVSFIRHIGIPLLELSKEQVNQ